MGGGGVGGIPSDYLVSTQLQLWLFCFWGCGCCWAVTIYCIMATNYFSGRVAVLNGNITSSALNRVRAEFGNTSMEAMITQRPLNTRFVTFSL